MLETEVMNLTVELWDKYLELTKADPSGNHPDDIDDFRKALHDIQKIIICRKHQRDQCQENQK